MLLAIPVFVTKHVTVLKWRHTTGSEWGDVNLPTGNAEVLTRPSFYFEDGGSYDFVELRLLMGPFCILRLVDE